MLKTMKKNPGDSSITSDGGVILRSSREQEEILSFSCWNTAKYRLEEVGSRRRIAREEREERNILVRSDAA